MDKLKALFAVFAILALSLVVSGGAGAQIYDSSGAIRVSATSQPVYAPALSNASFALSTACSTPTTPGSCASTSYKIFSLGNGGAGYSWQINAPNSGTFAFFSSDDGVNFFSSNLSYASGVPGLVATESSTTAAGKYSGIGAESAYVMIVATVAPSSAVTVYPYISQRTGAISVHSLPAVQISGTIPISGAPTPIPTLSPNADGGAPAHITNTSVPVAITTALPAGSANIGGVVLANNPCTSGTIVNYAVNISSAVTTQAVALSSGKSIYVCSLLLLANGTTNATLEYGTGSLCATGLTALTGPIPLAAQVGWVESSGLIPNYTTAASNAFCIVNSASVQLSGHILYVQQ